ncbi:MAG: UvrD-helicase domain-containing protein, partial [Flavobacteriales bacterium]|nr:UvrD-helicase domain-containing protein [Flavobacteriales bacterium]
LEGKSWNPRRQIQSSLSTLMKEESIPYRNALLDSGQEGLEKGLGNLLSKRSKLLSRIRDIQSSTREFLTPWNIELHEFQGGSRGFGTFLTKDYALSDPPKESHIDQVAHGELWSAKGKKNDRQSLSDTIRPTILDAITTIRDLVIDLRDIDLITQNRMSLILALRLEELMRTLEQDQGMSILADNNAKVSQLIGSNPSPFIYERVGERFHHFLIDEFQDTSVLQWRNLLPLLEDSLSTGQKNFLVGDAKQSIYRWRGGEVDQLVELPSIPGQEDRRTKELEAVLERNFDEFQSLQTNFRSARAIIAFNNSLFPLLAQGLNDKYQSAYADVKQQTHRPHEGYVRAKVWEDKTKLENILPQILDQIDSCEELNYRGSDICLLTRTRAEARLLADFLQEHGRSVASPDALLLKSHADVLLIVSLIEYLSGQSVNGPALYIIQRVLETRDRVDELAHWHQRFAQNTDSDILKELFSSIGMVWSGKASVDLGPYGAAVQWIDQLGMDRTDPYLFELLNLLAGFGSHDENTFSGFMDFWEEKSGSLSIKSGVNPASIQIMTIHASKGLQFPVVIVPMINWNNSKKGKATEWVETQNESLNVSLLNITKRLEGTPYEAILTEEKERTDLDNLNLLYVALTRAEDQMYINVCDPGRDGLGRQLASYLRSKAEAEILELGRAEEKQDRPQEEGQPSDLSTYERRNKDELLDVVLSSDIKKDTARLIGDLVHLALEKRSSGMSIDDLFAHLRMDISLSSEEIAEVERAVQRALELELELKLPQDLQVRSEVAILDDDGKAYRLDRVYTNKEQNKAWIIDYKTGSPSQKDLSQLSRYKNLLTRMGYEEIEAYLLYTESREIIAA